MRAGELRRLRLALVVGVVAGAGVLFGCSDGPAVVEARGESSDAISSTTSIIPPNTVVSESTWPRVGTLAELSEAAEVVAVVVAVDHRTDDVIDAVDEANGDFRIFVGGSFRVESVVAGSALRPGDEVDVTRLRHRWEMTDGVTITPVITSNEENGGYIGELPAGRLVVGLNPMRGEPGLEDADGWTIVPGQDGVVALDESSGDLLVAQPVGGFSGTMQRANAGLSLDEFLAKG